MGEQTITVTVKPQGTAKADFSFSAEVEADRVVMTESDSHGDVMIARIWQRWQRLQHDAHVHSLHLAFVQLHTLPLWFLVFALFLPRHCAGGGVVSGHWGRSISI